MAGIVTRVLLYDCKWATKTTCKRRVIVIKSDQSTTSCRTLSCRLSTAVVTNWRLMTSQLTSDDVTDDEQSKLAASPTFTVIAGEILSCCWQTTPSQYHSSSWIPTVSPTSNSTGVKFEDENAKNCHCVRSAETGLLMKIRLSVCPSVTFRYTVSDENSLTYRHRFFTIR